MKKKLFLLVLILLPINVFAASGSIKASTSSTKVTLNNTVTVTVKVSSSDTLGSWQYALSYDKKKLSLVSGDTNIVAYGDGTFSSKSYTYKFKAIATGTASVAIDSAKIVDWNSESAISTSTNSLTLTIKEPVIINYSSDNNLKSLSIEGFNISPEFNKSTLEYTATVKATTTSIKIKANANDTKAKVSGVGEFEVKEGSNSFSVVVTAENGTSKTYTLNVVVPEKDPVKYKFGTLEYSVLRKLPLNTPVNFNTSTLKFNDEEVPCLQNEKLNLTLIYLRDNSNHENFYIYDLDNKTIKLYNELSNNDLTIYLTSFREELNNMVKTSVKINNQEITAYQIRSGSKDYIVYGTNVSTGKSNYYVYDKNEKTISLFNQEDFEYLLNNDDLYKIIAYVLGILILLLLIIVILQSSAKRKMNAMINMMSEEIKELREENLYDKKKSSKKASKK